MSAAETLELTIPRTERHAEYVARIPMTAEEFIGWDHGNRLAEWVDGEAYIYMTTTLPHERILQLINFLLAGFCEITGAGRVLRGPFAMRARPDGPVREPDLMVLLAEHEERLTDQVLAGPADLAVEVVSEDSPRRDRQAKFAEYEAAGVGEYWIIDSREGKERAEFFVRGAEGRFVAVEPDAEGVYRSQVLAGFWLETAWLWQQTPAAKALGRVVGIERLMEYMERPEAE